MSPEMARHRAALRLAFAATLALVWGTMAGEPLPGLTAVLAAQILVGMPRPPRLGQAVALVAMVAGTGGAAFAVTAAFTDRLLLLTAALGLLFFVGFAMRERPARLPGPRALQECLWRNTVAWRAPSPRSPSSCRRNSSTSPSPLHSPSRRCSGSSPF